MYSCKVYRDIENENPKSSKEVKAGPFDSIALAKLVSGEKIIVNTVKGFKYQMTFSKLNGENLVGSVQKVNKSKVIAEESIEIPIQEIETLYAKRKSAGVTIPVLAVAGVAGYFVFIMSAYLLSD